METLPNDILRKIALYLSPADLVSFCLTETGKNNQLCNSNAFWTERIRRDFPEVYNFFNNSKMVFKNPKNTYMRNMILVSELIELYVESQWANNVDTEDLTVEFINKLYKVLLDTYFELNHRVVDNKIEPDLVYNILVRNLDKYNIKREFKTYVIISIFLNRFIGYVIDKSPLKKYTDSNIYENIIPHPLDITRYDTMF